MISTLSYASQIVRSESPLNTEPALDKLHVQFVTPAEQFYIRNHGTIPTIDPERFRLTVDGAVKNRLSLSLDEIKKEFPSTMVTATLQCAGNRRTEQSAIRPILGEVPWGAQAIGNAVWAGAPLSEILRAAGVRDGARHVAFDGLDQIDKPDGTIGFGASVSLEKALSPETILAYHMNGVPLDPIHGFPLRGIVPGYIGARSVKWLAKITVQDEPSRNYYQAHSYKLFGPEVTAQTVDWERGTMLEETAINSVICYPLDGDRLRAGDLCVCGYAIGKGGQPVDEVEISVDGGKTWRPAELAAKSNRWSWSLWQARVALPPGEHEIVVRASDTSGNRQPANGETLWNFKGYAYNARHKVRVEAS